MVAGSSERGAPPLATVVAHGGRPREESEWHLAIASSRLGGTFASDRVDGVPLASRPHPIEDVIVGQPARNLDVAWDALLLALRTDRLPPALEEPRR